ncbi:MAG: class I SAM-dependent methyltransferase [Gemmatimonadetes bacterium]|nr:class I SAM-dependent methyltransferase [Gemmatimonadota bacterium]
MYQRLFAWGLSKGGAAHERLIQQRKRELLAQLHGSVLEIGPGTGANLGYYAPSARLTGIEPNRHMHKYLRREAERLGREIEILDGTAERLDLADASVDGVVSTLVLCSVADQQAALAEVLRVLRPGGRFVFVEHVAARQGTWRRRVQRAVRPVWSVLGDGCRPDRETWRAIELAGFSAVVCDHFHLPVPVVWPHVAGWAVK